MAEAVAVRSKNKPNKHKKVLLSCDGHYVTVINTVWQHVAVFLAIRSGRSLTTSCDLWYRMTVSASPYRTVNSPTTETETRGSKTFANTHRLNYIVVLRRPRALATQRPAIYTAARRYCCSSTTLTPT